MVAIPRDRLRRAANVLTLSLTACAVVAVLGLATTLLLVPRVLDLQNLVIATGSMSPAFNAGDIALMEDDVEPSDIAVGDVIAYNGPGGVVTTHRVVSIETRDGTLFFSTKGDANDSPDAYVVPADALLGRAEARLPYLGWLMDFTRDRSFVMAAVLTPAALIVLNEVFTVASTLRAPRERPSA